MNKNAVITRTKQTLNDTGVFFTDLDLYDSITDGYNLVALFSGCIEKVIALSYVDDQVYYNLTDDVSDYYRPFAIYDLNLKQFLTPVSYKYLETLDDKWETRYGTPQYFCIHGFDQISFYPHFHLAPALGFWLFYKAVPPDLASVDSFAIPTTTTHVLIDYVVGDLFDQILEFQKSMQFFEQFKANLLRTRREVEALPLIDRCHQLIALNYGIMDR